MDKVYFIVFWICIFITKVNCACFEKGECTNSLFLDIVNNVESLIQCQEICDLEKDCNNFSYYYDTKQCVEFFSCPLISSDSCDHCWSGESGCDYKYNCFSVGKCIGNFLENTFEESSNDCLEKCRQNSECFWFDFNRQDYTCSLLSSCQSIDETNSNYVLGEKLCKSQEETSKVLVTGGFFPNEIVDLSTSETDCINPLNEDYFELGFYGVKFNDQPIVCFENCYIFDFETYLWTVYSESNLKTRRYATSIELGYNYFWIGGGQDEHGYVYQSSEFFKDGKFFPGPNLPEPSVHSCGFRLNRTHLFYGAYDDDSKSGSSKTFLINVDNTFEWIALPDLNFAREGTSACGFTIDNSTNTKYIIVLGGTGNNSVERLNMDSPNAWESIEQLPYEIEAPAQIQMSKNFFTFGGERSDTSSKLNDIYKIHTNGQALLYDQKLDYSRAFAFAFTIPEKYAKCY